MVNHKTPFSESAEGLLGSFAQSVNKESEPVRVALLPKGQAEIRVDVGSGHEKFILLVSPFLYPSRRLLKLGPELSTKLVLSPHLPEALAEELRQAGINHADLNGRLFIKAPTLLIDRGPRNRKHRNPVSKIDVFSGKTTRITRALLAQRGRAWTQEELVNQTQVSRGLVSRALTWLLENDYIERRVAEARQPASYQVTAFDPLLAAWASVDDWTKRCEIHEYSVLSDDVLETASLVRNRFGDSKVCFTQWIAAWLRRPHTTPPLVSAYVRGRQWLEQAPGRKVSSGGNLWLIVPSDEGVFFETQEVQGLPLVADIQIYLDLAKAGLRGPEAAEELRKWEGFSR